MGSINPPVSLLIPNSAVGLGQPVQEKRHHRRFRWPMPIGAGRTQAMQLEPRQRRHEQQATRADMTKLTVPGARPPTSRACNRRSWLPDGITVLISEQPNERCLPGSCGTPDPESGSAVEPHRLVGSLSPPSSWTRTQHPRRRQSRIDCGTVSTLALGLLADRW